MLGLLIVVLHLGQRKSNAHEVVAKACSGDLVAMLQRDGGAEIRNVHGLRNSDYAYGGDNEDNDADSEVQEVGKHALHAGLSADATGVPDIIYMTGPYMPDDLVEKNLAFVNWGTEFRYFDNDQMDASTKTISGKLAKVGVRGAYEAFRMLRPMAFRADIWRLMVLWDTGGYYLDAKMVLRVHISNFVDRNNDGAFAACSEDMENVMWRNMSAAYWSGVLAARPRDELVLGMIRLIIKNVEARDYGQDLPAAVLQITGPGVLTRAMQSANYTPRVHCRWSHINRDKNGACVAPRCRGVVLTEAGDILLDAVDEVHERMKGCSECSYNSLYPGHSVFCDEASKVPLEEDPCAREPMQILLANKYWSRTVRGVVERRFLDAFGQ